MQNDGDFVDYLGSLLINKGLNDDFVNAFKRQVRHTYGGEEVYICKKEKVDREEIRQEVKKHGVTKTARKYKRTTGFVYNYLR